MKSNIVVFDKFLGYKVGGAEISLEKLLKNLLGDFKFIGCEVQKSFSAKRLKEEKFPVERIKIKEIPKFPYLEYFWNRKKIIKFISQQKGDCLFAQGLSGCLAINSFQGKTVYFARDEYNLNEIINYYSGLRYWLKKIYLFIQHPFIKKLFFDNEKAIKKADLVIANSDFMKRMIKERFGKEAEVIFPMIDILEFQKIVLPSLRERPFLTLVGSEVLKGSPIVEEIAQRMKNEQFMIVGREFKKPIKKNNILYQPWSKEPLEIYKKTKMFLIPSLCQEAFCRVGLEGLSLGIPCLGSDRGGIGEVLDKKFLIGDVWDINKWVGKILEIEKDYQFYVEKTKKRAEEIKEKFNALSQEKKFKKIIKEKLNIDI